MADGKGRFWASGEIESMQIKDKGAMEARAEPKKNESREVDTDRIVAGPDCCFAAR